MGSKTDDVGFRIKSSPKKNHKNIWKGIRWSLKFKVEDLKMKALSF